MVSGMSEDLDPKWECGDVEAQRAFMLIAESSPAVHYHLEKLRLILDETAAGLKEEAEERKKLQETVDDLEQKVGELEDRLEDAWTQEDAEEHAAELVVKDARALALWGIAAGADPNAVRPYLTPEAGEVVRMVGLGSMLERDPPFLAFGPPPQTLSTIDHAVMARAVAKHCEAGMAPPEVVSAYHGTGATPLAATLNTDDPETEAGLAALNANINDDPALEGFL